MSVIFGERRRAHILAAQAHIAQQAPGVVERLDAEAIGQAISAYKSAGLSPADALAAAQDEVRTCMARIYAEYQARLVRDRADDADGLILGAHQILSQSQEARDFVHAQFKRIYVDEAQDFSLLQWRVLKLLAETATLMIVGDHLQSVYGFRQAVGAEIFNLFQREIAGAELLVLAENQRSRAPTLRPARLGCSRADRRPAAAMATYPSPRRPTCAGHHCRRRALAPEHSGYRDRGRRRFAVLPGTGCTGWQEHCGAL